MNSFSLKLIFHIKRAEKAYSLYLKDKKYFQALRIYKANREIYSLLNDHAYELEKPVTSALFDYLFHLEDWFEQFEELRSTTSPHLEDVFIFNRLSDSFPYPKDPIKLILNS